MIKFIILQAKPVLQRSGPTVQRSYSVSGQCKALLKIYLCLLPTVVVISQRCRFG